MQFKAVAVGGGEVVIDGHGPIVAGDQDRLDNALRSVAQNSQTVLGLALDSGGGSVVEGKRMSSTIASRRMSVVVPRDSQCASACFLMFAASPRRFAAPDANIGVHSASQNGTETDTSLAVTTLMARDAAGLGVPSSIIGKMVETTPGRISWLDPSDLALMHVTIYDGDLVSALRRPAAAPARHDLVTTLPASAAPLAPSGPSPLYTSAVQDRRLWEGWLAGLHGPRRDGALAILGTMPEPRPSACFGNDNQNRGDFTLGCEAAHQRLAPVAEKIKSSADYAAGWASGPSFAPTPPVAAGAAGEDYQGVYFCGRQIVRLILKMSAAEPDARRSGLFAFEPSDTGTEVARGSFTVEGTIDPRDGSMIVSPVGWVSAPAGNGLLGLNGRSEDGGKTFRGRVTGSGLCTQFTLARARGPLAAR